MAAGDREALDTLYRAACRRLDAGALARRAVADVPERAFVLGLGKVAHAQVRAALSARPDLVPLLSISTDAGPEPWAHAGGHPLPDERSFQAGALLLDLVAAMDGQPLVLLLSGGGSALCEAPADGLEEEDLVEASKILLRARLDIRQLNVVRKRLSAIKGGGLARAAPHSAWHVFAMSDVPGDDLATIASGPCTQDHVRPGEARILCERAGIWRSLPRRVQQRLLKDEPAPSLAGIAIEQQVLAGARSLLLVAEAESPWPTTALAPIAGPLEPLAERYVTWARERAGGGPQLLVAAGEPTLEVHGSGLGGRAQHLALLVARELSGLDATFLAAGTDGRDGPTEHAGAVVDGETAENAGESLEQALAQYDSASLHALLGTALPRWSPCTHLGELHLLLVR